MKKLLKKIAILGAIIAIIAIIYSIYKLNTINKEYNQVDEAYDTIKEIGISEVNITENPQEKENQIQEAKSFKINWEELTKINKEVIAWINIEGTNINYPIVQSNNNEKYIHKDIYLNTSKGGCIFVDSQIEHPFKNLNTIIYGHNLNNGKMFNDLKNYANEEYAKNHRNINIYTPDDEEKTYKVFAFCKEKSDNEQIYNNSVDNIKDYYSKIKKYNKINIEENIDNINSVITLSTCTNNYQDERYIIFAYI